MMNSLQCLRACRPCLARALRVAGAGRDRTGTTAAVAAAAASSAWPRQLHRWSPTALPKRDMSQSSGGDGSETAPVGRRSEEESQVVEGDSEVRDDARDENLKDEDGERVSEFRQMRDRTLKEDQESEDPVYKESYPRLTHRAEPMSVPEFRDKYSADSAHLDSSTVTLYGRVRAKRKHGYRLLFLDIVNEFERIQAMVNFKKCHEASQITMEKFKIFLRLIEVGDHVSITGKPIRSKSGELTINATKLPELLAPAMEQLPEKLLENRFRRRSVDLLVNQEATDILRLKSHITKYMRDYFHRHHFLEFQTPILAERAGGAAARPFATESTELSSRELMLRIAPELWLKRLVIGGVDKVFEIGPVFRNEGIDTDHNPEFTMCEFYSAYTNLEDLVERTEDLICGIAHHCQDVIATSLTSLRPPDLTFFIRPFRRLEFVPALEEALGFRLPKLTTRGAYSEMLAVLRIAGVRLPGDQPPTMPKLLDRLSAIYLEPHSLSEPIFITNYPACMSPLAKSFLCTRTFQLVSARTELFVHGREIANMYEEENDPARQEEKLKAHRELVNLANGKIGFARGSSEHDGNGKNVENVRVAAEGGGNAEAARTTDGEAEPLDKSYVKAMRTGLPPTGGWGCGVERLVMLFSGAERISDCFSFGTLRNVLSMSGEEREASAKGRDDGQGL